MTEAQTTMAAPNGLDNEDAALLAAMREAPADMRRIFAAGTARLRRQPDLEPAEALRQAAIDIEREPDPEGWRAVQYAEGPADAIWRTLSRAERATLHADGLLDALSLLAAQPSQIEPGTIEALSAALWDHVGTMQDAIRDAMDLARPLARAEKDAWLAARKEAEKPTPDLKLRTAEQLAATAAKLRAEARAETAAKPITKRRPKHVNGAATA